MEQGFPTPLASRLTSVSELTLENWDRRAFLKPSIKAGVGGRRGARIYSFRDLIAIRVADELRARGIEVHKLRRVVEYLRRRKGLELTTSDVLASTVLVTDGHDVYELEGDVTISALRRAGQRVVFVVPFGEIVTEIQSEARAAGAA